MKNINVKYLIVILCFLGLMLSMPSIVYLLKIGTVDGYYGQNYYFINSNTTLSTILGTVIFALIIIFSFIIYLLLIKNSDKFKSIKWILILVAIVSITFLICLPNTSTDVFYYMGTGRILEKYNQNPYYTTVTEVLKQAQNDSILSNAGYWSDTVAPYGPLWIFISMIFCKLSFGKVTLCLYIFKIGSLLVHLASCFIIYKITKRKKFAIMYGFNPFLLMEFLSNVHNDVYVVFFALLGIYFLKNKNDILNALIFLALSVLVKYVTLILAPFFALYYLRNFKYFEKIWKCLIYAIFFCLIIILGYMLFFNSLSDFLSIMETQQGRLKDSVYLILNYNGYDNFISPLSRCNVYNISIFNDFLHSKNVYRG